MKEYTKVIFYYYCVLLHHMHTSVLRDGGGKGEIEK